MVRTLKKSAPRKKIRIPKRIRLLRRLTDTAPVDAVADEDIRQLHIEGIIRNLYQGIGDLQDKPVRLQWEEALEEVAQTGDLAKLLDLAKWKRTPVDMEEFLFGSAYLAQNPKEIYPGVLEAVMELDTDKYIECVLKGAIGGGKTTIGNIGIPRQIYKISCMRSPQQSFGVKQQSSLVFTIQSVRLSTAKKAVFQELGQMLNNSPYFSEIYPYDKRIQSMMIFPQQNLTLLPVSSADTGAISMNVIGGLLDEVNFMQKITKSKAGGADAEGEYDQAKQLYTNLTRRRRSRFTYKGNLPGCLYLISSSRYPDDFTEEKAAESTMSGGPDAQIYVWSKSLWESKGADKFLKERFRVLVGNERERSRILDDDETATASQDIIEIPEDFRSDFVKDIDGAIRDFAGRTTLASRPFIHNRESIFTCMDLAERYGYRSVIPNEDVNLDWSIPTALEDRIRLDGPLFNQLRVAHVDLAVTRDSCGLAIGHVAGTRTCHRHNHETGRTEIEVLPIIAYDLVLRIVPPSNGEIDFSKVRQIIYNLRDEHGIPIKVVTTDGFQSVDFKQILRKKRFAADYLSLDRTTEPYKTFRDALYDGRILLPRHQHLVKELTELEYVRAGAKEKIDHKPRGSKDVADAVAGVASFLLTRRNAWSVQPEYDGGGGVLLFGHRTAIESEYLDQLTDDKLEKMYTRGRRNIKRKQTNRKSKIRRRQIA